LLVSDVDVVDNLLQTDHDCIVFSLDILPPKQSKVNRLLYNYKKANFDVYCETLCLVPWELASDSIEEWWNVWKDLFFVAVDDTILTVRWKKSKMKSWLSESTLKLIRSKCSCYKHMKADPSLWPKYKSLRNEVCNVTRRDYKTYVESITNDLLQTQKPFWSWLNKMKACRSPIPPITHDGRDYIRPCQDLLIQ